MWNLPQKRHKIRKTKETAVLISFSIFNLSLFSDKVFFFALWLQKSNRIMRKPHMIEIDLRWLKAFIFSNAEYCSCSAHSSTTIQFFGRCLTVFIVYIFIVCYLNFVTIMTSYTMNLPHFWTTLSLSEKHSLR